MPEKAAYLLVVPGFADWEPAHALAGLRRHGHYRVEVVGLTSEPVESMGGVRVQPTRVLGEVKPHDVAVFILPGGDRWEAGPPEPVFNPESKSNAGETATVGVKAPDWMVRRKQQKKKLQRQITLGLVVVAVLLTLVLIWVLFFRPKEKTMAANSLPYYRMVDSTPTTKRVFVVHSTVV